MVGILEELAEASRRRLLELLLERPKSVSELVEATGLKQPNVSNHLARLRTRGFVRASKTGRQVFYSLASQDVENTIRSVIHRHPTVEPGYRVSDDAREYARAAVLGEEAICAGLLEKVLRSGTSMVDIYQEFLGGAMTYVGSWYKVGAITEAGEHLASEVTERMMARAAQYFGFRANNELVAVLGCAPDSWHVIGLRMIGDYLRYEGWKTMYLGANIPIPAFVETLRQNSPDLILLSCNAAESVENTLDLIRAIDGLRNGRLSHKPFLIGVGGHSVETDPVAFRDAGADFSSRDLKMFAFETLPEIDRVRSTRQAAWLEGRADGLNSRV